jgi:hypothetical protein
VLLKSLREEQAKVAVQEVHDGICGAHMRPTRWIGYYGEQNFIV